jgi:signal transduction histidine kinase
MPILRIDTAAVFCSDLPDINRIPLALSVPQELALPATLSLASYDEFDWTRSEKGVEIPREHGYLSWMSPESWLRTEFAIIFARAILGRYVIIGLGSNFRLGRGRRNALYSAVMRIFQFLEDGFFTIDLDHLMEETGHLMGRAIGKVAAGIGAVRDLFPSPPQTSDRELLKLIFGTMDDGLIRLQVIMGNFYSFRQRRQGKFEESEYIESFDVLAEVKQVFRHLERASIQGGLKPPSFSSQDSGQIRGPINDFRLMLLNLIDNALKFSYVDSFITMGVSIKDSTCAIEITNLGVGVARDEFSSVFQPRIKSRLRNPSTRIEGLGLGLSYSKWVVEEAFKGKIRLESRPIGRPADRRFEGDNWLTIVTVEIPLAPSKELL